MCQSFAHCVKTFYFCLNLQDSKKKGTYFKSMFNWCRCIIYLPKGTLLRNTYRRPWSDDTHSVRLLIRAYDICRSLASKFSFHLKKWNYLLSRHDWPWPGCHLRLLTVVWPLKVYRSGLIKLNPVKIDWKSGRTCIYHVIQYDPSIK